MSEFDSKDFKQIGNPGFPWGDDESGRFMLKYMDGYSHNLTFIESVIDEDDQITILFKSDSGEFYNCYAQCEDNEIMDHRITMYSVEDWKMEDFETLKD